MPARIFLVIFAVICVFATPLRHRSPTKSVQPPSISTRVDIPEKVLISPSLRFLGGGRLSVALPEGWRIVDKDPASKWATHCYAFTVKRGSGATAETQRIEVHECFTPDGVIDMMYSCRFDNVNGIDAVGDGGDSIIGSETWNCNFLSEPDSAEGFVYLRIPFGKANTARQAAFATYVFGHFDYLQRQNRIR